MGGGVFWTDLKNSVGEVEAQILHGAGVDRNVQRIHFLLFPKNMGGVFLNLDSSEEFCRRSRSPELEGCWSRSQLTCAWNLEYCWLDCWRLSASLQAALSVSTTASAALPNDKRRGPPAWGAERGNGGVGGRGSEVRDAATCTPERFRWWQDSATGGPNAGVASLS